jgi:glycosyltransferase involved in cell wall biosynthesis
LDLNLFTLMPQSQARERLNLSRSKRLVLFVGNPKDPRKRFDLAQKAVNLVDASLNTEMVVAWDVAHTEIPVFMNACDLLIFTSMHEGSPNVVKEALACNLPVVSVVVGDVPERLKGLTGSEVCADDQPETIAAAINRVLQLPRGTDGRAAAHLLDEEVLTQRVIAVYEQVLNPGRARQPSGRDAEMTTARPVVRDHAS